MKIKDTARIVRPLGHMERLQTALHATREMCATVITCRYAIPQSVLQPQTPTADEAVLHKLDDIVTDAIARSLLEHPALLVGQDDENAASPSFTRIDEVDLDHHITWITVGEDGDYETRFQERTQWSLDTWFTDQQTRPGWRISIMRETDASSHFDLIFAWNHVHIDGIGGKIFHETLLRQLNPQSNSSPPYIERHVLKVPAKLNMPPPQEKVAKHPTSKRFAAKTVWAELKPPFMNGKVPSNASWCPIRVDTYGTKYRCITTGPSATKNLLEACRRHDTTLTGLLHGLCLISVALQLGSQAPALTGDTAIDQRRFLPTKPAAYPWFEPHKAANNFVTILQHTFSSQTVSKIHTQCRSAKSQIDILAVAEDIVWSAAKKSRRELQDRIEKGLKDDITGLFKFVNDWPKQLKENARKPRGSSWAVTNLGVIDGGTGEWKITKALFQIPAEQAAAAFGLACVSVRGGDFNTVLQWQDGVLDDAMGDKLASDLQVWLDHMGSASEIDGDA